jgi:uncharacterized repeat protein (TIGR03803 family)
MAASVALACAITVLAAQAQAQTYKVLYSFCSAQNCTDGSAPSAGVIQDAKGNLYGTTFAGGAYCYLGCGTVFKLSKRGRETVLHSFCSQSGCPDGAYPYAGLIQDVKGNFYGATVAGGLYGHGTVFKLNKRGKETVLYSFCQRPGCTDGALPYGGLVRDAKGNLYGTTSNGGDSSYYCCGVVFRLDTSGKETVLYNFCSQPGCPDGEDPGAGLIQDAKGNLYGTTYGGGTPQCGDKGQGCGVVFKLDTAGKETVLYSFLGGKDGGNPFAGVMQDPNGNRYGTTYGYFFGDGYNYGSVFKLSGTGEETLYTFCAQSGCSDGAFPEAGVVRGANGSLYGTTSAGGEPGCSYGLGCGVVFKLDRKGKETVLYSFCRQSGCADGASPYAGLIQDAKGNLYGTTNAGGVNNCGGYACGTVFKLTPN